MLSPTFAQLFHRRSLVSLDDTLLQRYVPWVIWLGKSRNHEELMRQFYWFRKETTAENLANEITFYI